MEEQQVEKKDVAMNGDVEKDGNVLANGVDDSPVKDDGSHKVVITKTVETITTGEDGSKHVTKSVTVTETLKESQEEVQEVAETVVSSKKTMEKHQTVVQVTETAK